MHWLCFPLLGVLVVSMFSLPLQASSGPLERPFVAGVCTHFAQHKGHLPENMKLTAHAGATSIRDEVPWGRVEYAKGSFRMPPEWDAYVEDAVARGIEPLIILNYGNRFYDGGNKPLSEEALDAYVRYCQFVVGHFKGKVRLYEVWNEYDIGIGVPNKARGSADDYVKMLQRTYPAIKAVDSSITVLGGAMTAEGVRGGWLERMLELDGLKFCDAVSIHTYLYSRPGRGRSPETWAAWMIEVQALLRKYNAGRETPLYITEMGWPTHAGDRGMARELSADYLARMFLLARTMPFLKGIWWYDFQDDGWRADYNEHNFGLVRPDLSAKPSYHSFRSVAGLVSTATAAERLVSEESDLWILRLQQPDKKTVLALWSADETREYQVLLRHPSETPPGEVLVEEIGRPSLNRNWGHRGWAEKQPSFVPNQFSAVAGRTPILLSGDLAGVIVEKINGRSLVAAK
jgi:polysaccharide biosynthesis protein PslG